MTIRGFWAGPAGGVANGLAKRDTVLFGMGGQGSFSFLAKSTFGHVKDAAQRDGVVWVIDGTQVG